VRIRFDVFSLSEPLLVLYTKKTKTKTNIQCRGHTSTAEEAKTHMHEMALAAFPGCPCSTDMMQPILVWIYVPTLYEIYIKVLLSYISLHIHNITYHQIIRHFILSALQSEAAAQGYLYASYPVKLTVLVIEVRPLSGWISTKVLL
jgi:hypothetical protein